jgi:hypothetical protein
MRRANGALSLEYPVNLHRYFAQLDVVNLADTRPVIVGVRDYDNKRFQLAVRVLIDPEPLEDKRLLIIGEVRLRKGIKVRTLDGRMRVLFPGQRVRLRIEPQENISQLEFREIIT